MILPLFLMERKNPWQLPFTYLRVLVSLPALELIIKKTEALWIGSCVGKEENLLPEKNIQWNESKVKFLGVWLSTDPNITLRTNYDEKLEKIRIVLNSWKLRRLTLIGKIVVLKSLAASHLPYILAPLETDERFLKEINQIFYDFLWNNKGDKIKRSVLINSYVKGGSKWSTSSRTINPLN